MTAATALNRKVLLPADFHTRALIVNGLRMHMADEGDPDAPLVILLHGFPEFWYSWRYQIEPLVQAGYHVVVPDQRGYNLSDKHGPYDLFTLSDDIAALIEKLGYRSAAAVIGHDWGGWVTWAIAARFPWMVDKAIVCNMPHPHTALDVLKHRYLPQLRKSWYMYFFQLPNLPERQLSKDQFHVLVRQLHAQSKGKITRQELVYFVEAWSQPGAITGGLNWYRALFREFSRLRATDLTVSVPSLLIWGDEDAFLTTRMADWTANYVRDLRLKVVRGVSHWVQQEAPDQVNPLILEFLTTDYRIPNVIRRAGDQSGQG